MHFDQGGPANSLDTIAREDWPQIVEADHRFYFEDYAGEGVLALFRSMESIPSHGYPIAVYRHSLQTASRCFRDGESEELVVVALLHDLGTGLTSCDHGKVAATIMRPFISEQNAWLLEHHPIFQEYYYADKLGLDHLGREAFRGHPHFEATLRFCELWDHPSFDPDYEELPLSHFEPMVRRLFARAPK